MKTQPTTNPVLLYGSAVGFLVGVLAPLFFGFLIARELTPVFSIFSIFTGPLGAILGAYLAVFWKTSGLERKKLTVYLFPKLGGIVGVTLGFWVPAVIIFPRFDDAIVGVFFAGCAGTLMALIGAASGKYLAILLMRVWPEEETLN
jgi:uncharacterized membrane protein